MLKASRVSGQMQHGDDPDWLGTFMNYFGHAFRIRLGYERVRLSSLHRNTK